MLKGDRGRRVFFMVVALTMLSELFLSNLGTLLTNVSGVAFMLGITVEAEIWRLVFLMIFDCIAGVGALLTLVALVQPSRIHWGSVGVPLTALGLTGYGLYQLAAANLLLAEAWRLPISIIGLFYCLFGALAWVVGRALLTRLHRA